MIGASPEDLARWEKEGRQDLLGMAKIMHNRRGEIVGAELWFDPKTGRELMYCPWLRREGSGKCTCLIRGTRPSICREYFCRKHVKNVKNPDR
jgi:Fe-S-cluster containining protein